MGKILLIEPGRVLRQAITLFLSSEHEIMIEKELNRSELGALNDYDLLIVDGGALREANQLTPEFLRTVQSCKMPILWLEDQETAPPAKEEKFLLVKKPVEREALRSALDKVFAPKTAPKRQAVSPTVDSNTEAPKRADKQRQGGGSQQEAFQFVDLVDVVEDQPPPKGGKKRPGKSK